MKRCDRLQADDRADKMTLNGDLKQKCPNEFLKFHKLKFVIVQFKNVDYDRYKP